MRELAVGLDLAFIMQQYRNFGKVTDSILMVLFAQSVYAFDSLFMEPAILTTIDIILDGVEEGQQA